MNLERHDFAGQDLIPNNSYGLHKETGIWFVRIRGSLGNLGNHKVTVHKDGTITVSPSILISWSDSIGNRPNSIHGFLEHGEWRDA